MAATEQELRDAQLQVAFAEIEVCRNARYASVAQLAVSILNDKHASTGRNVEAAVAEAVAVYRGVVNALKVPA